MADAGDAQHGLSGQLASAVQAQDWDLVVSIVENNWPELVALDPSGIRDAVKALPDEIVEKNPRWATARNYLTYLPVGDGTRPLRYRDTSIPSVPGAPVGLLDALVGLTSRTAARRSRGEYEKAALSVDEARGVLSEASEDSTVSMQRALADLHYQWGMSREFAGQEAQALEEFHDAYDLAALTDNSLIIMSSAGNLAWLHSLAGRTAEAQRWLARVPKTDPREWHSKRYTTTANLARALRHLDRLEYSLAATVLNDDVDVSLSPEYWAAVLLLEARIALGTGDDPWRMLSAIDAAVASRPTELSASGFNDVYLSLARSELYVALDQAVRARSAVAGPNGARTSQLRRLAQAKIELLADNVDEVRRLAEPLVSTSHPRVLAEALLLSTVAQWRSGLDAEAAATLSRALRIVEEHELPSVLTIVPRSDLVELLALPGVERPDGLVELALERGSFMPKPGSVTPLSPKEQAVLARLVTGASMAEIAAQSFVSQNTIKTQLRSIYRKLGVTNRTEAETVARRHGLFG